MTEELDELDERRAPEASPVPVAPATLDAILVAIAAIGNDVRGLREDYDSLAHSHETLRRKVEGSEPPDAPASPNGAEPIAKQAARGSSASFDLEELKGEFLAVRTELKRQSSAMGLSGLLDWFASAGASAKVARIVGTLVAVYAALHAAGLVR